MRPWFLDRFEGVTPAGDEQWRATCPACGGRRSFSIGPGKDRWRVNCFAASGSAAHRREALAIVELTFDSLLFESERRGGDNTLAVDEPSPSPPNERPECEMRGLLREHGEGRARRVPADMPALPLDAPKLARLVYEDMALRWELRLGADMPEDRPLPYAVSEAVNAGFCRWDTQASRAIHWLEDHGLIWSPGTLDPLPNRPSGTRMFLPGPRPVGSLPVEACRVKAAPGVGRAERVQQPAMEVADEPAVRHAVAGRGVPGFAAAEGVAGDGGVAQGDSSVPLREVLSRSSRRSEPVGVTA